MYNLSKLISEPCMGDVVGLIYSFPVRTSSKSCPNPRHLELAVVLQISVNPIRDANFILVSPVCRAGGGRFTFFW